MSRHKKKILIPLIGLSVVSWTVLAVLVAMVDPNIVRDIVFPGSYLPFFLLVFFSVFFTLTLLLNNTRRGVLLAAGITVFMILRLLKLGNVITGLLLVALIGVIDFYFHSR